MAQEAFTRMAHQGLLEPAHQGAELSPTLAGQVVGHAMPVAEDPFFAGEIGLVATFDFDYESIIEFETALGWAQFLSVPPAWIGTICCVPCFLRQNVEWRARAKHVTLTVDGIRYVTEKRKSLCGLTCSDVGKQSKTVPYDKITDCDVQEPAGAACCCCIPKVLSVVNVDTASSGGLKEGGISHELALKGLKFPNEFKQAVWGMKRGQAPAHAVVPFSDVRTAEAQFAQPPQQVAMNSTVLVEIRDELRQMNTLLRETRSK